MAISKHVTKIQQGAAGATVVVADDGDKTSRVHYIFGTLTDAGTLAIAGTSAGYAIPPFEVGADTPIAFGPITDIDLCPSIDKQGLNLVSTGGKFIGVVGVSQGSLGSAAP